MNQPEFPPMSRVELDRLGWDECDVIIVTGDAYVDHPSFGSAIIARVLIDAGFRTGLIAQPDWKSTQDFEQLGRPRLFFGITAGNVDSLVNHYSPLGQKRRVDAYSPAGEAGLRPNRATIIYTNRLRETFPDVRLVLGGIEASLRRLAHFDYWDNKVRRSILLDAKADIIAYGLAERAVVEIAHRLKGDLEDNLKNIPGTVISVSKQETIDNTIKIPSFEQVNQDKQTFHDGFMTWYAEQDQPHGKTIIQQHGDRLVVQYPPQLPLTQKELDRIYDLPYRRQVHPIYRNRKIPALETVKFSITSHRGCLGSCTFCTLAAHQGRIIQWRSLESIENEARLITQMDGFKGHITDVGGPTANMYATTCPKLERAEPCRNRECLFPKPCPSLQNDCQQQLKVLETIRHLPSVKKVSIGTGLRYDLIQGKEGLHFLTELCRYYISGQLRIAPEHSSNQVLARMHKTSSESYQRFLRSFDQVNSKLGRKQYLIPYYISGFPDCTLEDMVELAEQIERSGDTGLTPKLILQVQDFTPLPMTLASLMYYTGIDPFTGEQLYVARDIKDKKLQRAILQLRDPVSYAYAVKSLRKIGSQRLIKRISRLGPKSKPTRIHHSKHW
jgi:uncharacterized radical SAM protein YgiQ